MTAEDRLRRRWEPERISLGACHCPGMPHDEDEAWVIPQKAVEAFQRTVVPEGTSPAEENVERIVQAVVGSIVTWNLLDADGERRPLDVAESLDFDTLAPVENWFLELIHPFVVGGRGDPASKGHQ